MRNKILAFVIALALLPVAAGATTFPIYANSTGSGGSFRELPDNYKSTAPGYVITLPVLAQNDSVVVYLPFGKLHYLGWKADTPTGGLHISMDCSAAADSVACVVGIGDRLGGVFNSPFSAGLQAWVRTTATPAYGLLTATTALWFPGRICRVIMKSKGATAIEAGRKAYVTFPRAVPLGK